MGYVILKHVYNELGIDKYLKDKQKEGKMEFDLNQIFSLLVFSRILYPTSKKSTYENKTIYFDKFDFSIKDMYRALDYFYKYKENLSDLEIRNIYRGLSKIEETFKVTKSLLNARPVFVWTNEHIEARFLTCFISLYITRLLENKLSYKYSAQKIINSLRNYTSTNIEYDIYLQDYYDGIINDLNSIYNLNLDRKYLSLSEIKKILKI